LGVFLLLLRILRRVRHDVRRGRCYLPQDEMRQFGVAYEDLSGARTTEAMRALFRRQAERMRDLYRRAFAALPDADRWGQRHAILLAELAGAVLDEIEADGFRVTEHHVALTPLRKLWLTWRVNRRERRYQRRYRASAEPVPKAPA
jgi:phytoene synthase